MNVQRLAVWSSSAAVAAAVIAGLVLSGPPAGQRLKRLDAQRVSDLQALVRGIDRYWEEQGTLPDTLKVVVDGRRLSHMPTDPVSGVPYPYEVLLPEGYRLCAAFDQDSEPTQAEAFWAHPAGEHCFEFQVRRDRIPQR